MAVQCAHVGMPTERGDTVSKGVSMDEELFERVVESMGPGETNLSGRICELLALGLATEEAADNVDWPIPDNAREKRTMIRQAFQDADRFQRDE